MGYRLGLTPSLGRYWPFAGGTPAPPANDNILLADNGDFLTDDAGNLLENA